MTSPEKNTDFSIRFWGVRGTIACPGPKYARYGGNTSCIEVCCGDYRFILDGGTGLRPLGEKLLAAGQSLELDLYLTHTHLDHIAGLPFFPPMFKPGNKIRLLCGHLHDSDEKLRDVIVRMTAAPLFPVPLEAFSAELSFVDFRSGETLQPRPGVVIRTAPLNHPNGATAYRIEFGGKSACYVTDCEHREGELDEPLLDFIRGTDIFIYDSTFTDDEYPKFRGWGHSTWQEGARLAEAAGVGEFVIFHHAPEHPDAVMDGIAEAAHARFARSIVAREGMVLRP
ncbi:MAG: MBL fold metallo-hydrolase [Bauldia litoralis]